MVPDGVGITQTILLFPRRFYNIVYDMMDVYSQNYVYLLVFII